MSTAEPISMDNKDGTKPKKSKSRTSKSVPSKRKERAKKEIPKKSYKLTIRKLPTQEYNLETFQTCLDRVVGLLDIKPEHVDVLHFMEGKLRFELVLLHNRFLMQHVLTVVRGDP